MSGARDAVGLLDSLCEIWGDSDSPCLIYNGSELRFSDITSKEHIDLSLIRNGDIVALIGDFDPLSIQTLLRLIELNVILVPLTLETIHEHEYFFETALVDVIISNNIVTRRSHDHKNNLVERLRAKNHAGLIAFSTGTTGRPKAILHDLTIFLRRFQTPRPGYRTLSFLLFDHVGGINTLLHTLFNKGVVIAPESRGVESILAVCGKYKVEVLPTTPTFLRIMLMSGAVPKMVPDSLKVITYGTERMDQSTLSDFCKLLPHVDFRQTYGISELGVLRVKSLARDSLFMKIGGEGVETKVKDGVLQIRSESRMLGYLNASEPFDHEGWYNTNDIVESVDGFYRVVGRVGDVINVGGLKFMASEVEQVAMSYPDVSLVKVTSKQNPITGQHVEITVQPTFAGAVDEHLFMAYLKEKLQPHMVPKRVRIGGVEVGHRFKRS
jgi:acyl-CoA synthetase (AMP-forming)/AMP-acid ligase II